MITKKQLQEQLQELGQTVHDLKNIIVTDELKSLREDKKRFTEQTELISDVKFRVKSAKIVDDDTGSQSLVIIYQLPMITIPLDEKGDPIEKNSFFYAVNALGLVSLEDYDKIRSALEQAKNNINKK